MVTLQTWEALAKAPMGADDFFPGSAIVSIHILTVAVT